MERFELLQRDRVGRVLEREHPLDRHLQLRIPLQREPATGRRFGLAVQWRAATTPLESGDDECGE
jgi:hypothetical protein